jgi:hypothetical protein
MPAQTSIWRQTENILCHGSGPQPGIGHRQIHDGRHGRRYHGGNVVFGSAPHRLCLFQKKGGHYLPSVPGFEDLPNVIARPCLTSFRRARVRARRGFPPHRRACVARRWDRERMASHSRLSRYPQRQGSTKREATWMDFSTPVRKRSGTMETEGARTLSATLAGGAFRRDVG